MTGIYIHVPFCERKCPYCAFYSVPKNGQLVDKYLDTLVREMASVKDNVQADTIYFGGGTPPLLGAENIARVISLLDKQIDLTSPEITVECNPNSITPDVLKTLRSAGVNRLSVGVQSLDDRELRFLGRLHNALQAEQTIENALSAGFENISADLMLGIKGQTAASVEKAVSRLEALGVKHISVYMIKTEPGTPFDSDAVRASLSDEDDLSELYLSVVKSCEAHGFPQYEISNFSRLGFESRHNLKYWLCEEYLGFGPSAHSYFGGVRYRNADTLDGYSSSDFGRAVTEPSPDRAEEYVMLGLRLNRGISLVKAASLGFGEEWRVNAVSLAQRLGSNELCIFDGDRLSLTSKGMLVSNSVIGKLIYE